MSKLYQIAFKNRPKKFERFYEIFDALKPVSRILTTAYGEWSDDETGHGCYFLGPVEIATLGIRGNEISLTESWDLYKKKIRGNKIMEAEVRLAGEYYKLIEREAKRMLGEPENRYSGTYYFKIKPLLLKQ